MNNTLEICNVKKILNKLIIIKMTPIVKKYQKKQAEVVQDIYLIFLVKNLIPPTCAKSF